MEELQKTSGKRGVKTFLPLWFANLTAPFAEAYYRILRQPPLYTKYSLYTLQTNAHFSHKKSRKTRLMYRPRPIHETLADTIKWLIVNGRVKRAR